LRPQAAGTLVTHYYEVTKLPVQPFRSFYGRLLPHHRDMRPHRRHTLDTLKAELESRGVGAHEAPA
jgi:hypothetical protein